MTILFVESFNHHMLYVSIRVVCVYILLNTECVRLFHLQMTISTTIMSERRL